jgi:NAD(P)-dependent dehydrogenase (short-subunit alcohol dehydrogenase family)
MAKDMLAGRVAIVTGVASGLRHGVARCFAREGAHFVACFRPKGKATA